MVLNNKPRQTAYDRHKAIKETNPKALTLIRVGDHYEAYGTDATRVRNAGGSPTFCSMLNGQRIRVSSVTPAELDDVLTQLRKFNPVVAVCEPNKDKKAEAFANVY